jgi:hypothetical protein
MSGARLHLAHLLPLTADGEPSSPPATVLPRSVSPQRLGLCQRQISLQGHQRWPTESTFRTGKDAFGWDQCQARTFSAQCRHTALTALAQLRAIAAGSALVGAPGPPNPRSQPGRPRKASLTWAYTPETHRCPSPPGCPARPPSSPSSCRLPRLPASSASPAATAPGPSPPPGSRSISAGQTGVAAIRPAPAGTTTPPGSPHWPPESRDRKEVTTCNQNPRNMPHAKLQRGHQPRNSNCNTC